MIVVVVVILIIAYVLRTLQLYIDNKINKRAPPHFALPIFGKTIKFISDQGHVELFFEHLRTSYGRRSHVSVFGKYFFVTCDPVDVKFILNSSPDSIEHWSPPTAAILERGALPVILGDSHTILRRQFSKLFSNRCLADYLGKMQIIIGEHLDQWNQEIEKPNNPNRTIAVQNLIKYLAFDVVYGCMIDMKLVSSSHAAVSEDQPKNIDGKTPAASLKAEVFGLYEQWLAGLTGLPFAIPGTALYKGIQANVKLAEHVSKFINERDRNVERKVNDLNSSAMPEVIDMLIGMEKKDEIDQKDEGKKSTSILCRRDLIQNLIVFLVAGHETIVGAANVVLRYVGDDRQVMNKLVQEVHQVVGKSLGPNQDITLETLKMMPYSLAVVKEGLRLMPPVGAGLRIVKKEVEIGGYRLYPGEMIAMDYNGVHENTFAESDKFKPERWIPAEGETQSEGDKGMFLPFSGGERSCIGMKFTYIEIQLLLVMLVAKLGWWEIYPANQNLNWAMRDGISRKYISGLKLRFNSLSHTTT